MKYENGRFVHVLGEEYYFSQNLRYLRLLRSPKLSQEKLAKKLGVSRGTYAHYERGTRMPPVWFVLNTANYFNVAIESLLNDPMKNKKKGAEKA